MNSALYDTAMRPTGAGRVSARSIQIGLGLLWLLDGLLQLQPKMFGPDFAHGVILPMVQGQPAVVSSAMTHVAHLVSVQPALADTLFAAVQILIGAGLLVRETVKPALVLSFAWALGVWALGEGFGMLFTGGSPLTGAPGAALLYVAIGVLAWPRAAGPAVSGPAAADGPLGARGGKAVWAVVWSGMGILWLLPANRAGGSISGAMRASVAGEPGWLAHGQLSVSHALGGGGGSVAVVAGVLSFVIGLGPLVSRHTTAFLVAGAALALDYWVFGEAFGGMFTGLGRTPTRGPCSCCWRWPSTPTGPGRHRGPRRRAGWAAGWPRRPGRWPEGLSQSGLRRPQKARSTGPGRRRSGGRRTPGRQRVRVRAGDARVGGRERVSLGVVLQAGSATWSPPFRGAWRPARRRPCCCGPSSPRRRSRSAPEIRARPSTIPPQ